MNAYLKQYVITNVSQLRTPITNAKQLVTYKCLKKSSRKYNLTKKAHPQPPSSHGYHSRYNHQKRIENQFQKINTTRTNHLNFISIMYIYEYIYIFISFIFTSAAHISCVVYATPRFVRMREMDLCGFLCCFVLR